MDMNRRLNLCEKEHRPNKLFLSSSWVGLGGQSETWVEPAGLFGRNILGMKNVLFNIKEKIKELQKLWLKKN